MKIHDFKHWIRFGPPGPSATWMPNGKITPALYEKLLIQYYGYDTAYHHGEANGILSGDLSEDQLDARDRARVSLKMGRGWRPT